MRNVENERAKFLFGKSAASERKRLPLPLLLLLLLLLKHTIPNAHTHTLTSHTLPYMLFGGAINK